MAKKQTKKQIEQYEHSKDERANIPHVGLVTPASDPDTGEKKTYQYDPHLDPQLQWAGKAEHTSFEVPTVSLHVHERIDPKSIIETVKKEKDDGGQMSLFSEKKPLREAIDFYKHKEGWTNRLIAGDSLLVMNSLLEKEGMAGKVQMVYFDPPYGIKYGSNFQPFVNKRDVTDGKDDDLSSEPEMIKAFRDTWELGIHSYLTYLRDRLLLAREVLNETGSCFLQISDDNMHHVRELMDEVFGPENFISMISYVTSSGFTSGTLSRNGDRIIWYAKDKSQIKFRRLFIKKELPVNDSNYKYLELEDGTRRLMTKEERQNPFLHPKNSRIYRLGDTTSQGSNNQEQDFEFEDKVYQPSFNRHWSVGLDGMKALKKAKRLESTGKSLSYVRYFDDFPYQQFTDLWTDTGTGGDYKIYSVQTNEKVIERCLLMATDPGELVLDITCGSGTTAFVSEKNGRRWMTCDTSRISIALAKQRIMTSQFDFYKLAIQNEGISSGLVYENSPQITMKSAGGLEIPQIQTFYDKPIKDNSKTRVTGSFTVEAVPAPYAKSFDELEQEDSGSDNSIARSGETNRQAEWRDELLRAGVRAKGGIIIQFTRVKPLAGTKYIQAEAETKEDVPKKVLVVFGPEHAPLEQRMVENAWQEARALKPDMLLFCAFQFDEEAAKDIDELTPAIAGMQLIKAQMNADMLTDDLRKKRSSNESFWLVGQPDVRIHKLEEGKIQVEVMGFDYYNPKTGNVESGGKKNIAMWMLDTDYDNRSLFPSQVFFPMAGSGDGWDKLAKNLKAEIDEEKIESFKGTTSLPFEPGSAVAVKIIDDRGIESLRVLTV
ncbi:MAG: site-specific DNA-methyltransferase [Saprospiraceae bacterium]|jgi:adenine-specific DNA-methyltransferase|nr:site-specific DNA-methyltransferase [Saprospiraceae bacterium]